MIRWFDDYKATLRALNICTKRNIINFDETNFLIGCIEAQDILVPDEVRELYAASLENRKSLSIFESIDAAGNIHIPSLIVIASHEIMPN